MRSETLIPTDLLGAGALGLLLLAASCDDPSPDRTPEQGLATASPATEEAGPADAHERTDAAPADTPSSPDRAAGTLALGGELGVVREDVFVVPPDSSGAPEQAGRNRRDAPSALVRELREAGLEADEAYRVDEPGGEIVVLREGIEGLEVVVLTPREVRGDLNGDGRADAADLAMLIEGVSRDDPSADFNGDGRIDDGDVRAFGREMIGR